MTAHRWLAVTLGLFLFDLACGAPPAPSPPSVQPSAPPLGQRRRDLPDDCAEVAGQPPPEPLRTAYAGVAKAARCQREVYTIMGGVTHFLGVECKHCHREPDYTADTHNKQIANWMARELVPRLTRRSAAGASRDAWCQDCHAGKAKLLGDPRRRDFAIEWMTTHMTSDFDTAAGKPPKCRDCHGGDLGSAAFRPKIILGELSGLPLGPTAATAASVPAPGAAPPASTPPAPPPSLAPAAPSATALPPIPDFGKR